MRKIIYIVCLLVFLSSCQTKPVEYTLYIQSSDTINPITLTCKGNFKQVDKIDKRLVFSPTLYYVGGTTSSSGNKEVSYQVCRSSNQGLIRGYIGNLGNLGNIEINNQQYSLYQILDDNIKNKGAIMTNDSLLNYLKNNGEKGYFEFTNSTSCYDGIAPIK
ncbi:hypothetical protein [Flavobacterium filum]|uniref:hypothetical protein n=1 Tax=Flavobacterium filum TaxID=370974 RepID=UPI0023F12513|nr:hypothetical protein [Flavobacterium filum]